MTYMTFFLQHALHDVVLDVSHNVVHNTLRDVSVDEMSHTVPSDTWPYTMFHTMSYATGSGDELMLNVLRCQLTC